MALCCGAAGAEGLGEGLLVVLLSVAGAGDEGAASGMLILNLPRRKKSANSWPTENKVLPLHSQNGDKAI